MDFNQKFSSSSSYEKWLTQLKKELGEDKWEKKFIRQSLEGTSWRGAYFEGERKLLFQTEPNGRLAIILNKEEQYDLQTLTTLANGEFRFLYQDGLNLIDGDDNADSYFDVLSHYDKYQNWDLTRQELQKKPTSICFNLAMAHDAGATIVQELAGFLALIEEMKTSIRPNTVIMVKMALSSLFFHSIAKLKAYRFLCENAFLHLGLKNKFQLLAVSSLREYTLYDPWTNVLRGVTGAQAAMLGGADLISLYPHDHLMQKSNLFSNQLAMSNLLVLKKESNLLNVGDVTEESYLLEHLACDLVGKSLYLVKMKMEDSAFDWAQYACEIELVAKERKKEVRRRKRQVIGVNQYANVQETFASSYPNQFFPMTARNGFFPLRRPAYDFEKLRFDFESLTKKPAVHIHYYGNYAALVPRLNFCRTFFEVAGLQCEENAYGHCSLDNMAINVLVAEDQDYKSFLDMCLKEKFAGLCYIATAMSEAYDSYRQQGLTGNIYLGMDCYELLAQVLERSK